MVVIVRPKSLVQF